MEVDGCIKISLILLPGPLIEGSEVPYAGAIKRGNLYLLWHLSVDILIQVFQIYIQSLETMFLLFLQSPSPPTSKAENTLPHLNHTKLAPDVISVKSLRQGTVLYHPDS